MKASTVNKLTMYRTVMAVCESNNGLITTVPAFIAAFSDFRAKVAALEELVRLQVNDLHGVTRDRDLRRSELATLASMIGSTLVALSGSTGENRLFHEGNYSISRLMHMSIPTMMAACSVIHERASEKLALLVPYNVDQALLDRLNGLLGSFVNESSAPAMARDQRKLNNRLLARYCSEADIILRVHLDNSVKIVGQADRNFYELYKISRGITNHRGRQRAKDNPDSSTGSLSGSTSSSTTALPLAGVLICLTGTAFKTISDLNGAYTMSGVPPGTYELTAVASYYNSFGSSSIEITAGEGTLINISMIPAAQN